MKKIMVELPWFHKNLNPNARIPRQAKIQYIQDARSKAYWITKTVEYNGLAGDLIARYIFCPPDKRRRDLDNCLAACKAYQDGVFDALALDDRLIQRKILDWGEVIKGSGAVVLELSELNPAIPELPEPMTPSTIY